MEKSTVKEFVAQKQVTSLSVVRFNTNNLPFVTFLGPQFEGGAENIYFSKSLSEKVQLGMKPSELGLKDLFIMDIINAEGETRTKIAAGSADYESVDNLF